MADPASVLTFNGYAIAVVALGFAGVFPVVAWLMSLGNRTGQNEAMIAKAVKDAEVAREKAQDIANQLAAYKLEVSNEFVRQSALEKVEKRLMDAINEMRDEFRSLVNRLMPQKGSGE